MTATVSKLVWSVSAGGTGARADKYGYSARPDGLGEYHISPVSSRHNVNRHVGYVVHYVNTAGRVGGGLWHQLAATPVNLATAKRICREHWAKLA